MTEKRSSERDSVRPTITVDLPSPLAAPRELEEGGLSGAGSGDHVAPTGGKGRRRAVSPTTNPYFFMLKSELQAAASAGDDNAENELERRRRARRAGLRPSVRTLAGARRPRGGGVTFLASLSIEARDELRGFVEGVIRDEQRARERRDAQHEWLTTADVAGLVSTSENAVRCRLRRGWLAGDVARDGKRLLIRRSALLDWLDRRAQR
jgi:hypothetical protein